MAAIQDIARQFFDACEAGKGWAACRAYCRPDAGFSAQAGPPVDVKTLQGYADWMQGLMKMMPDGHYDLKCWATDAQRNNVIAYATFIATHTGPGGPRRQNPPFDAPAGFMPVTLTLSTQHGEAMADAHIGPGRSRSATRNAPRKGHAAAPELFVRASIVSRPGKSLGACRPGPPRNVRGRHSGAA